jgi:hypothetical protein
MYGFELAVHAAFGMRVDLWMAEWEVTGGGSNYFEERKEVLRIRYFVGKADTLCTTTRPVDKTLMVVEILRTTGVSLTDY